MHLNNGKTLSIELQSANFPPKKAILFARRAQNMATNNHTTFFDIQDCYKLFARIPGTFKI